MKYFETERLIFRDWNENDLIEFRQMNKSSKVMEYFPKIMTEDETDMFYNRIKEEFIKEGYGLYAVELKNTSKFIGFIGLHKALFEAEFTPCIEIGWRLKSEEWGKGYATEGAKGCLNYAFNRLGVKEIYSFTASTNLRSQNVMKKIGMKKVMEFNHPNVSNENELCRHVLYKISLDA